MKELLDSIEERELHFKTVEISYRDAADYIAFHSLGDSEKLVIDLLGNSPRLFDTLPSQTIYKAKKAMARVYLDSTGLRQGELYKVTGHQPRTDSVSEMIEDALTEKIIITGLKKDKTEDGVLSGLAKAYFDKIDKDNPEYSKEIVRLGLTAYHPIIRKRALHYFPRHNKEVVVYHNGEIVSIWEEEIVFYDTHEPLIEIFGHIASNDDDIEVRNEATKILYYLIQNSYRRNKVDPEKKELLEIFADVYDEESNVSLQSMKLGCLVRLAADRVIAPKIDDPESLWQDRVESFFERENNVYETFRLIADIIINNKELEDVKESPFFDSGKVSEYIGPKGKLIAVAENLSYEERETLMNILENLKYRVDRNLRSNFKETKKSLQKLQQ